LPAAGGADWQQQTVDRQAINQELHAAMNKELQQAEAARKKELEKMKVRQQYEAYMKLKSNSEIKYDVEKAKEYEELNSDIRSLISSIGQVQDNATNLKTKKVL
jgi:hypothetical protein